MFTRNYSAFTSGSSPILEGRKFVEPLHHVIHRAVHGNFTLVLVHSPFFNDTRTILRRRPPKIYSAPGTHQFKLSSWCKKKKKRERETQKLHASAIVSTFLPRKRNCTVVSALYRNLSRSTVWLESLYITFYGNLLTWSENKLGRNRSVETVCNPRGLRSSIRGNMQISKSILSKLFLIIVGILKFCY